MRIQFYEITDDEIKRVLNSYTYSSLFPYGYRPDHDYSVDAPVINNDIWPSIVGQYIVEAMTRGIIGTNVAQVPVGTVIHLVEGDYMLTAQHRNLGRVEGFAFIPGLGNISYNENGSEKQFYL